VAQLLLEDAGLLQEKLSSPSDKNKSCSYNLELFILITGIFIQNEFVVLSSLLCSA